MSVLLKAPIWVWPLLAVLILLGVQSARPRTLSGAAVFVWPVMMTMLSVYGLVSTYRANRAAWESWLFGFVAAIAIDIIFGRGGGAVLYDAHTRRFEVPGSWMPLALILTLFCTRFAIGVANARFPQIVGTPAFLATVGLASGAAVVRWPRARSR
jgi:hypothetical protein